MGNETNKLRVLLLVGNKSRANKEVSASYLNIIG